MKLLLVSHGMIAEGFCNTMKNFFGAQEIYSASVTLEGGAQDLVNAVNRYLEDWGEDEQVVICSDIMGGSANQNVYPFISRPNTFLVAGMNLPLVIQLHIQIGQGDVTPEQLRHMVKDAQDGIILMNDQDFSARGEDDE